MLLPDCDCGGYTGHNWHAQVQQHHIRKIRVVKFHCFLAICRFADDDHIVLLVNDGTYSEAGYKMIIRDENPNGIRVLHGNGMVSSTAVPLPGCVSRCNWPPTRRARSRMPTNPK